MSDAVGDDSLPIRMLHDRVLVSTEGESGERRSGGGIVIPATVAIGKRLAWAKVIAVGANVRRSPRATGSCTTRPRRPRWKCAARTMSCCGSVTCTRWRPNGCPRGHTGLYL